MRRRPYAFSSDRFRSTCQYRPILDQLEPRRVLAALGNGQEVLDSFITGSSESFEIQAFAGGVLQVSVGETGSQVGQPELKLFDPNNQLVTNSGGDVDATLQAIDTVAGTYTAVVSEQHDDAPLSFRVRAVALPGTPSLIAGRDHALSSGEEVFSSLPLGTFGLFTIDAVDGGSLRVAVGETGDLSASPAMQLFDPSGQRVGNTAGGDNASLVVPVTAEGVYTALVTDEHEDQPIEFRIRAVSLPSTPSLINDRDAVLASGEEVEADVPLGGFNLYRIEASEGGFLRVAVGDTSGTLANTYLDLIDPNGQSVDTTGGGFDANLTVHNTIAGFYTAVVAEENYDAPISVRVRAVSLPSTPSLITDRDAMLASGEVAEGDVPLGTFNLYRIEASQGGTLRVAVGDTSETNASVSLRLIDPAGQSVKNTADDFGAALQIDNTDAGFYTAIVGESNDDEPISYRIRAVSLPGTPSLITDRDAVLNSGEEVEASVPLGSFNLYRIEASAGGSLRVSVGETGDLSAKPALIIYDPNGQQVTHTADSDDATLLIENTLEGTYTALVGDENEDRPISFRVRAVSLPGTPTVIPGRDAVLASGDEVEGDIPLGTFNVYQIEASEGGMLRVSVAETGNMLANPALQLFAPNGEFITHTTGSDEATLTRSDTVAGTYTVIVHDGNDNQPMSYRFRALTQTANPTLIPGRDAALLDGESFDSTVPLGLFNLHRIDVNAGDQIEIDVERFNISSNATVRVFDSSGVSIAARTNNPVASLSFEAPATEVLTIAVYDVNENEPVDYRISVAGPTGTFPPIRSRKLFYNDSSFDTVTEDGAISDRKAFFPGSPSGPENISSYVQGINGVMIDMATLANPANLDPTDFTFRVGRTSGTSLWTTVPVDPSITLRPGAGEAGSDRVTITWPNQTITNTWLEVTVKAGGDTGLAQDDLFYFGSQIADVNGDGLTNASDFLAVRGNATGVLDPVAVDNLFDVNRDGRVNAIDLLAVRDHATSIGNALPAITPSGDPASGVTKQGSPLPLSLGTKAEGESAVEQSLPLLLVDEAGADDRFIEAALLQEYSLKSNDDASDSGASQLSASNRGEQLVNAPPGTLY